MTRTTANSNKHLHHLGGVTSPPDKETPLLWDNNHHHEHTRQSYASSYDHNGHRDQYHATPTVMAPLVVYSGHDSDDDHDDSTLHLELSMDEAIELLGYGPFQQRILVAVGLCFAASCMEMSLFSFLALVLQHTDWHLTGAQTDALSGAVFAGGLLGNVVLGPLADQRGRKPVFLWTASFLAVFGLVTAVTWNYTALWTCRFAVGFGVGGMAIPFDCLAEFVPLQRRGTHLLFVEYFWTAGTILVPLVAWLCLSNNSNNHHASGYTNDEETGWRLFCAWCALPSVLTAIVGVVWVPESPRWLLLQGQHDHALEILRAAARQNGKNPRQLFPAGMRLVHDSHDNGAADATKHGHVCDLLADKHWKTTLLLWGVWSCQYFVYFGSIMAVTLVFVEKNDKTHVEATQTSTHDETPYAFDFGAIFIGALAEAAGTTVIIYLIDRIGRIPSQALSYLTGGLSVFILCALADAPTATPIRNVMMVVAAFLARLSLMSGTCATWVSTAEILPTEIRTTGHTAANAVGSLSAMFSPYVVSNETAFSTIGRVILFLSVSTTLFVVLLPETKDKCIGLSTITRNVGTHR